MAEFTYLFIARPLAYKFVKLLHNKDEEWGKELVSRMKRELGENPIHFEIKITKESAFALCDRLSSGEKITLGMIKRSREDWKKRIRLIFLFCKFGKDKYIILPDDDVEIKEGMRLLIASTEESKIDFEYIINNYYELRYVLTGN